MNNNLIHVTDDSFDEDVLQSDTPVLVDYWAEWCGPCKMIAPILDEVSTEYSDKLKIAKLDVDQNQTTSTKYGVRGIPTLMLFKEGNIIATHVGALTKSQLTALIEKNVQEIKNHQNFQMLVTELIEAIQVDVIKLP